MENIVPDYLVSAAAESGDVKAEVLVSLALIVEEQTKTLERIAEALERSAKAQERVAEQNAAHGIGA